MSFAGHVFDMIRRSKEYRDVRNLRRSRAKDSRMRYTSHIPDITADEFERIRQQTKERELQEQHYILRTTWIILSICAVVVVLLLMLFSLFA